MKTYEEIAADVVEEYESTRWKGEARGACQTIARLVAERIGPPAEVVGGLCYMDVGPAQHWWVEVDSKVIDPLAEEHLDPVRRREVIVRETPAPTAPARGTGEEE